MSASSMPTLQAVGGKAEREVDGGGRLADAALAGGDRDDRLDAGHAALALAVRRRRMRRAAGAAVRRAAARRRARARRDGASMPPPFFSAVSATTAPATPGIALTTRSAAARSGSSSCARAAGTVIEKNTLASAMKMSETMPRLTMSPSKSGPRTVLSLSMTASLVTDIGGALLVWLRLHIVQIAADTKRRQAAQLDARARYFARSGFSASAQRNSSSSIVLAEPVISSVGVNMPSSPIELPRNCATSTLSGSGMTLHAR